MGRVTRVVTEADRIDLFLFAAALISRVGYWLFSGTTRGGDFRSYVATCDIWWSNPVGIVTAHKDITYAGFTLPFCSVYDLPWTSAGSWVVVQILLSCVTVVLVYRTGRLVLNRNAGLVAGLAMVALWDTFQWTTVLYSDAMFTFAFALVVWALAKYKRDPSRFRLAALFATMLFVSVTRPFGFPIVIGWFLADAFGHRDDTQPSLSPSRLLPIGMVVGLVAALPTIVQRRSIIAKWRTGWIVINDGSYVYEYPVQEAATAGGFVLRNVHHIVVLGLLRVGMFFAPFVPRHSLFHILVNIVTYLPITILGLWGLVVSYHQRRDLFVQWGTPVLVVLAITAVTFVSWDFRYRAPLGVVFALATGYLLTVRPEFQRVDSLLDRYV